MSSNMSEQQQQGVATLKWRRFRRANNNHSCERLEQTLQGSYIEKDESDTSITLTHAIIICQRFKLSIERFFHGAV